jgi:outer membrane protein assembly factor BamA
MRTWLSTLLLCTAGSWALAAQRVWRGSVYPSVAYSTIDDFWGAAHYTLSSPIGFVERPEPYAAAFTIDAGASTGGSYRVVVDAQAPAYWDGWRLGATLAATRDNRLGFYGFGNDTPSIQDSVTATAPFYYRVSRTSALAQATMQRRLVGPLRLFVGGGIERTDFRSLPGPSVFRSSVAQGVVDSTTIPFVDPTVRVGLVFDTRDNEFDPHSGAILEALLASGRGYTRTTGSARAYVPLAAQLVLAGRIAGEGMGGSPPLAAQFDMESSERAYIAVGGYQSLRGFYDARFVGAGKLLGGVEMRYAVKRVPSLFAVVLSGFCDVGRVFGPEEPFRFTTSGLHASGGGHVGIRFLRNSLLVLGAGAGSEGAQLLFTGYWSY